MCPRRHSWSWLLVVLFMVWSLLAPLGTPLGSVAPASAASTVANPDLNPTTCPLDVVLLLDESSSIRRSGYTQPVKDAVTVLLDQLEDTGSQLAIIEFSDAGRLEVDYHVVDAANRTAVFQPYLDTEYVPGGTTNWAHPLSLARDLNTTGPVADLLVLLGDGPPNRGGAWPQTALDAAVAAADLVKSDGTHIFGLGIKTLGWGATTFAPVFGPDAYSGPDLDNDDYVLQPNGYAVADTMTEVVESLCSGAAAGIDIQKLISIDGGATYIDADTPPGPMVFDGDIVFYRFELLNSGAVELTDVAVVDDVLGPICSGFSILPGETVTCDPIAPEVVARGLHTNTATATAMAGAVAVSDMDPANYTGFLPGTIVIFKFTDPASGVPFDFTSDILGHTSFSLQDTDSRSANDLFPGTYTINEVNLPAGWTLGEIACSAPPTSTWSRAGNSVVIDLAEGDTVGCDFDNEQAATISIQKIADPDDGTDFQFTTDIPAYPSFTLDDEPAQTDGVDESITMTVPPGTWTITEDHPLPTGWTFNPLVSCGINAGSPSVSLYDDGVQTGIQVNIAPGDDILCWFENFGMAYLAIEKEATPEDGTDFPFVLDTTPFDLDDDGDPVLNNRAEFEVPPGDHTITETLPPGWVNTDVTCNNGDAGAAGNVTTNLAVGDDVTCTFTNDKEARITIEKAIDGIGAGEVFGFSLVGFTGLAGFDLTPGGAWDSPEVTPGDYTITEDIVPAGWALSDVDCGPAPVTDVPNGVTVHLAGEDVTCVFTNVEAASITILKDADIDDGTDFSFGSDVPGHPFFDLDDEPIDTDGVLGSRTMLVPAGTYTFIEFGPPPGWDLNIVDCVFVEGSGPTVGLPNGVSVSVTPGDVVECTFANESYGEITIIKVSDPSDGTDFPFVIDTTPVFTLDDDDDTDATFPDTNGGVVSTGPHSIHEIIPFPWEATDVTCDDGTTGVIGVVGSVDVDIDVGEHLTCTFTNTLRGEITITKSAPGADPAQFFEFDQNIEPGGVFPLFDGDSRTFSDVLPGTYSVLDHAIPGWGNTAITCDDGSIHTPPLARIELGGGESIECTFLNELLPDEVDLIVYKEGPSEVTESSLPFFPTTLAYVIWVVNASPATATGVQLTDTLPAGVTDSELCVRHTPIDCTLPADFSPFTSPVSVGSIAGGAAAQVIIKSTVVAGAGSVLENTATVSSSSLDPDPSNNTDTLLTTVIEGAPNPDVTNVCGNTIILLDESASVKRARATEDVRDGVFAILESMKGTGVQVAIIEFSDTATLVVPYTTVTEATIAGEFTTYLTTGYNPSGTTNWAAAFFEAFSLNANAGVASLVFGITDGNPNRPTGFAIPAAVAAADAVQAQGSHVFLGGIGYVSEDNLRQVAGPNQWPDGTPGIGHADFFRVSNFPSFTAAIADITQNQGGICGGSLSVLKQEESGPSTGAFDLAGGWEFLTAPAIAVPVYANPPDFTTSPLNGMVNFQWDTTVTNDILVGEFAPDRFIIDDVGCEAPDGTPVVSTHDDSRFEVSVPTHDRVTCTVWNRYAAEIWGRKFHDLNGNGVDDGEPGLEHIPLSLSGTDDQGSPVSRIASTGPDGVYSFTRLRPGTYTITETPPIGALSSTSTPITLTVGWGEVWAPSDLIVPYWSDIAVELAIGNLWLGSINGIKFHDLDGDGVRDGGVVSWRADGEPGNGQVTDQYWSPDGTKVAFVTSATNLVASDSNGSSDIFVRDLTTNTVTLVTVNHDGTGTGDGGSFSPRWSPDGTKVMFNSYASDLVATDTNGQKDIFVHDLVTGTTSLVTVNPAGDDSVAGAHSNGPRWSPDGTRIAFASSSPFLVAGDANAEWDIFVRDLIAGQTEVVTLNTAGADTANGFSSEPVWSPDGTRIAFISRATDLTVHSDANAEFDVFVRDLTTATTSLVSEDVTGNSAGDSQSYEPVWSPDGSRVMFSSWSTDLVAADDTNLGTDVFIRDLAAGITSLVSVTPAGTTGDDYAVISGWSPDGTKVAFGTEASDMGLPDSNFNRDLFVRDLVAAVTLPVSVNDAGTAMGNGGSFGATWSPDGSAIFFRSFASDLVATDTNGVADIFVYDIATKANTAISTNSAGTDTADGASFMPAEWSPDSTQVAYMSLGSDLTGDTDTNGDMDVFVSDVSAGSTTLLSTGHETNAAGDGASLDPQWSPDGSRILFKSVATDLVPGDTNTTDDVFMASFDQVTDDWDIGEPPIAGVDFTLTGTDGKGVLVGPIIRSSDSGGFYGFVDLWPGIYEVTETVPAPYLPTTPTAVNVTVASTEQHLAESGQVALNPWEIEVIDTSLFFGNTVEGSIHGFKFLDLNGDGVYQRSSTTEFVTANGDGAGGQLIEPHGLTRAANGDVYVTAWGNNNVLRVTAAGTIVEIVDTDGAGPGMELHDPMDVVVDADGNVIVAGYTSHNVFKVTPGGVVTELMDATGDGSGNPLTQPTAVAADGAGNVFVAGLGSDNVFLITSTGAVSEIIDGSGDGFNPLSIPTDVATDPAGNVFVSGAWTNNVFRITPAGVITQVIDATGDGAGATLDLPEALATDSSGNLYVTGVGDHNVFKVTPAGVITEIMDATGDGTESCNYPGDVAVDSSGTVYVMCSTSNNIFAIAPDGTISLHMETGEPIAGMFAIATGPPGTVFATGEVSDNVLQVVAAEPTIEGVTFTLVGDSDNDGTVETHTTTTGPTHGSFAWWGLYPGVYEVTETVPAGHVATTPVTTTVVVRSGQEHIGAVKRLVVGPSQTVVSDDRLIFGDTIPGSIHGLKFHDGNGNGVRGNGLVSHNAANTDSGGGLPQLPEWSPDGTKIAFQSSAPDHVSSDVNGNADIFVYDALTGVISLVSTNTTGLQGGDGDSAQPQWSPDSTKLVFASFASDLVATDTNGHRDLFVFDLATGITEAITVNAAGTDTANDATWGTPYWSPDSAKIAYWSRASDLVTFDNNGTVADIFIRDLATGVTQVATGNPAGTATGDDESTTAVWGPDSTQLAFESDASNLVSTDTNGERDLFVYDASTGVTTLISINASGTDTGSGGSSRDPVWSQDGTRVAFWSSATDLVSVDNNASADVFVRDLLATSTILLSKNGFGTDSGDDSSTGPAWSPDGTRIAFESLASDLVAATDANTERDLFVVDADGANMTLVTVDAAGTATGDGHSQNPRWSPDSNQILFWSFSSDLVAVDSNADSDAFVRNLATGVTTLVSVNSSGTDSGAGSSSSDEWSPDGTKVSFVSGAPDIAATDTNGSQDLFVYDLVNDTVTLVSINAQGTDAGNDTAFPTGWAPDSRSILIWTEASDLVATDTNGEWDIFMSRLDPFTGSWHVAEPPIAGVDVTLTGTDSLGNVVGPLASVTSSDGEYGFGGLMPGTYAVTETVPDGMASTTGESVVVTLRSGEERTSEPGVVLDPGQVEVVDLALRFGNAVLGSVHGHVFRDLDRDGIEDAPLGGVFANGSSDVNRACAGDGTGSFTCVDVSPDTNDSRGVALGYLDADHNLDVVFANVAAERDRVCLGDGSGGFRSCDDVSTDTNLTYDVALGLVNADAHLDAVFANDGNENRVCFGDGAGAFPSCNDIDTDRDKSYGVALGFVDRDAHLDAVFANWQQENKVCLGDGSGGFSCDEVSGDRNISVGVDLGLIDGDAYLDAIFANDFGQSNRVCLGDGGGGFTCSDASTQANSSKDVALGFIDGDVHLDAVFGNLNSSRVCLGDGTGWFFCIGIAGATNAFGVGLGDINDDSRLDVVFARWGLPNLACLGSGVGGFACSDVSADTNDSAAVALGPLAPEPRVDRTRVFLRDTNRPGTGTSALAVFTNEAGEYAFTELLPSTYTVGYSPTQVAATIPLFSGFEVVAEPNQIVLGTGQVEVLNPRLAIGLPPI